MMRTIKWWAIKLTFHTARGVAWPGLKIAQAMIAVREWCIKHLEKMAGGPP